MTLDIFTISLLISILLCSLVAGLLFGFAVVVMPGIAKLSDREFLMSFKNMDGIIQLSDEFDISDDIYYDRMDAIKDNLERAKKMEVLEDFIWENYLQ